MDRVGFTSKNQTDIPFPESLPEFQEMFPDEKACADYLAASRWGDGFVCPHCKVPGKPYRFSNRPGVIRCPKCRRDTGLTVGTVMADSHTPLSVWFWAAYLMSSQTPGMSARQFQRQLGLTRYETAFQILHKLRASMVRPNREQIGGTHGDDVEVDETWVGGRTQGKGKGVHDKTLVVGAVEVRWRKGASPMNKRRKGRYAGRVRLTAVDARDGRLVCGFLKNAVLPGTAITTDGWEGYNELTDMGYKHFPIVTGSDAKKTETFLPLIHLVFSNLKTWLLGIHHGVSPKHLQAYLNEFTFRFNRRFYPFNAFRSLLGIAGDASAPTYADLYSGKWRHPRF
jgi:transposase-like protein